MSVKQAPEELLKKYTEMGFKKMWINKEFQRFCSTVSLLTHLSQTSCQLFDRNFSQKTLKSKHKMVYFSSKEE